MDRFRNETVWSEFFSRVFTGLAGGRIRTGVTSFSAECSGWWSPPSVAGRCWNSAARQKTSWLRSWFISSCRLRGMWSSRCSCWPRWEVGARLDPCDWGRQRGGARGPLAPASGLFLPLTHSVTQCLTGERYYPTAGGAPAWGPLELKAVPFSHLCLLEGETARLVASLPPPPHLPPCPPPISRLLWSDSGISNRTQVNQSVKQRQTPFREQTGGCQGGGDIGRMDREFGISTQASVYRMDKQQSPL